MQHGSENSVLSHAVVGPDGKAKSAGGRNRDQGQKMVEDLGSRKVKGELGLWRDYWHRFQS